MELDSPPLLKKGIIAWETNIASVRIYTGNAAEWTRSKEKENVIICV